MTDDALVKLLFLSLAMVGAVRLVVVVFVGDHQEGPAIGRIKRRLNVSSGIDVEKEFGARERPISDC
jgi:hypothetical protein